MSLYSEIGSTFLIVSSGEPIPGVYARVSEVVGWIEENTSSGRFCKRPTTASSILPVRLTSTLAGK